MESYSTNYGHYRLEQCFTSKGPFIGSQPNHVNNYMRIDDIESGELYRNTNVMKLKNCIDEYEDKFTRTQHNLLGERYFATSDFVCKDLPCSKLAVNAFGKYRRKT
jgi:hypothetical protein